MCTDLIDEEGFDQDIKGGTEYPFTHQERYNFVKNREYKNESN